MLPIEIEEHFKELDDRDSKKRLQAVRELALHGPDANQAAVLEKLQRIVAADESSDVRVEAVKALSAILKGEAQALLLKFLSNNSSCEVRIEAADALELLSLDSPSKKELEEELKVRLATESDQDVRQSIARAVLHIDDNPADVTKQAVEYVGGDDPAKLRAAIAYLMVRRPPGKLEDLNAKAGKDGTLKDGVVTLLWKALRKFYAVELLRDIFGLIVHLIPDNNDVVKTLLDEPLANWKKSSLLIDRNIRDNVTDLLQNAEFRPRILEIMLLALQNNEKSTREAMVGWFIEIQGQIHQLQHDPNDPKQSPPYQQVQEALWRCQKQYHGQGLDAYMRYADSKAALNRILDDKDIMPEDVGGILLAEAAPALESKWNDKESQDSDREAIMPFILAAASDMDWRTRQKALHWLQEKAVQQDQAKQPIPGPFVEKARAAVKAICEKDHDPSVQNAAREALAALTRRTKAYQFRQLQGEGAEQVVEDTMQRLIELQSRDVMRALISQWTRWIAEGDRTVLVETAAEQLRTSPDAVLPLIDQVDQDPELDEWISQDEQAQKPEQSPTSTGRRASLRNRILKQLEPRVADELIDLLDEKILPEQVSPQLRQKINSLESGPGQPMDLSTTAIREGVDSNANPVKAKARLFKDKLIERRKMQITRRIAKLLADMSDSRLFEGKDNQKIYEDIKAQLKKHAVPALAHRLPREPDLEIRESLARALANVGELQAVDALALAVVGEERTRTARQDLLARYYLEPSRARSEDAAKILKEAVVDARKTLTLQQRLNTATFAVGIVILVGGVLTAIIGQGTSDRFIGMLAGLGGLAGVITLLVQAPLDRIQNAMANLVQLETAFTSFIWELNLNGTYIQSRYVAEGVLTGDEIAQTVNRIEGAMNLAMNVVSVYTKEGRQRVVTRISALTPGSGEVGAKITVIGQYLLGDDAQKKVKEGMIAVNHIPITPDGIAAWKENQVEFKLPNVPGLTDGEGTILISLLVDGMETNSLPFNVIKKKEKK